MKFTDEEKTACSFKMDGGWVYETKGNPLVLAQQLSAVVEALLVKYRQDTANQINTLQTLIHDMTLHFEIAPPVGSDIERRLKLAMPAWQNPVLLKNENPSETVVPN